MALREWDRERKNGIKVTKNQSLIFQYTSTNLAKYFFVDTSINPMKSFLYFGEYINQIFLQLSTANGYTM